VKREAESGLSRLGLVAYGDRCAGTYSGGNKRKLSTAIALIGDPSVVFLDEPTSGMDPGARRFLWNSILAMVRAGQSVVLTSHSMEECEALCSRIGIMVNGGFKCIGSIQHLKNRFGSGYSLTVRCLEARTAEVVERLGLLLPLARLQEEHHTQLKFQLPTASTRLPVVFRHLEQCREEAILQDYSITQTTLDEVFVRFASEQTELLEDEMAPDTLKSRLLARLGRPASRATQA
jgi:ABC-type multidrug transport system ATPase subunit